MELKVKRKTIEIKFDYRTMFKVDKKLATVNPKTGERNNDGVGTLFNNILNQNDAGLVDLIILCAGKTKASEDDAIAAIEDWLKENNQETTEKLFDEIKEEMVDSGFFKQKISKYIDNMKEALPVMEAQDAENKEMTIQGVRNLIGKMENAISL